MIKQEMARMKIGILGIIELKWMVLKEMAIPDHLTCLLRNLYASQELDTN